MEKSLNRVGLVKTDKRDNKANEGIDEPLSDIAAVEKYRVHLARVFARQGLAAVRAGTGT